MGVDLGKTKVRQQEEEQKSASRAAGGFRYWTPKKGKNRVRLLPPWTSTGANADQFERELYTHWNVGPEGKGMYTCPRKTPNLENNTGQCPICEEVDRLRATGDPADEEVAKNLAARQRFYSNIIDLDDPVYKAEDLTEWASNNKDRECPFQLGDTKIGVFTYGSMIYKELLDIFADLGMDITDPQNGRDLIVKREGEGKFNTRYRVILDPQPKPLVFVGQKSLAERLPNLDLLSPPKKPEELRAALAGTEAPAQVGGGSGASQPPGMPAPQAQKSLPASQPAPAAQPTPQAQAPKPAAQPQAAKPAPQPVQQEVSAEDRPECFSDTNVWSDTDPECIGGVKGADEYDPCPHFQACGQSIGKLVAPEAVATKSRRRGVKAAPVQAPTNGQGLSDADLLEQQMAEALR